jgi:hypothetical protein
LAFLATQPGKRLHPLSPAALLNAIPLTVSLQTTLLFTRPSIFLRASRGTTAFPVPGARGGESGEYLLKALHELKQILQLRSVLKHEVCAAAYNLGPLRGDDPVDFISAPSSPRR